MGRHVALLVSAIAVLVVGSCATQPGAPDPLAFDEAPLFGMVYDADNQPCAGVALSIDGGPASTTDVRGRFVLPALAKGEHRLTARKEGYEELDLTFRFLNRTDVLYLRMSSFQNLLTTAEDAMDGRRWGEAAKLLDRAAALDAADPVLLYLRALHDYRTERFAESAAGLEGLLRAGVREAHVHLLLADLYEKHLDRPTEAAAHLVSYLALRADPEAERRLEALRGR